MYLSKEVIDELPRRSNLFVEILAYISIAETALLFNGKTNHSEEFSGADISTCVSGP
jgi:hypothetical protein